MLCVSCQKDVNTSARLITTTTIDSIDFYIKNKNLARAQYLNSALTNDSIKNSKALKVAYSAFKINDTVNFLLANKQAFNLSHALNDSLGLGEAHWNYGSFYTKKETLDSSYYHYFQAQKYFELKQHEYYSAKMLYNMAFIQSRLRDYTSAEGRLFQAISIHKRLNKTTSLYKCYSLLGTIYKELGDYQNSVLYHQRALDNLDKVRNKKSYYEGTLNDLGITYHKMGSYAKAVRSYKKGLSTNNLYFKDPYIFSKLIDNLAYSNLKNNNLANVETDLFKSLTIRDSLKDLAGVVINKIHLAEYFATKQDTTMAIKFATESHDLAVSTNNNRDILASLLILSKIDKENSSTYLHMHVELTDKLEKQERQLRNKFARIRFETDAYITEAQELAHQKTLLLVSIISSFIMFALLYFLRSQRAKTKELLLETRQQQANEEIYELMLKQQTKLEEGRLKERYRISEELHDGVLGKIYGARMGMGFLELEGSEDALAKQEQYLQELQVIEQEIRDVSHELKNEILSSSLDYISLIENLVIEKSTLGKFDYNIHGEASIFWNQSSEAIKINVYRIVQEALQNCVKHAKATHIALSFKYNNDKLVLVIKDDGVGFNTSKKNKGIGLLNMQSRIESLGGTINMTSQPLSGTIIEVKIPYDQ